MRPHRRYRLLSEINVTPLTDVMLVLLIIFMATSSFILVSPVLNLSLPEASGSPSSPRPEKTLVLEMNIRGTICLEGKILTREQLKQSLLILKSRNQILPPVLLRVEKSCSYENFVQLLDLLSAQGLNRISLAVEPEEKKP